MDTRKYPRTLNEAFGPTAHGSQIQDSDDRPFDWQDIVVMIGCFIAACAYVALFVLSI